MSRTLKIIALGLFAAAFAAPLSADPTPGPPAWDDGASAYLDMMKQGFSPDAPPKKEPETPPEAPPAIAPVAPPVHIDHAVTQAVHNELVNTAPEEKPQNDARRLAPPNSKLAHAHHGNEADGHHHSSKGATRRLAQFGLPFDSLYTILTALAVVIGAFLVFAWALRRGGRAMGGRNAHLPADVVSVLGRVPLAARQFAELLRVGNKLVLVSLTPTGAETLTEVTDPAEVDRLVGLCQQRDPHSTSKAFEHVFQQMSGEAAHGGFLGDDPLPTSLATPAGAYRAHRGRARG